MKFIKNNIHPLITIFIGLVLLILGTEKEFYKALVIIAIGFCYLAFYLRKDYRHNCALEESSLPAPQDNLEILSQFIKNNQDILAANYTTYGQIKIIKDVFPQLKDSKFGGIPYWPQGTSYPTTKDGTRLSMIAQINCQDVPPSLGWPRQGIVQFFLNSFDDLIGLDFDNQTEQNGFRVIYHEDLEVPHENQPLVDGVSNLPLDITQPQKIEIMEGAMLPNLEATRMTPELTNLVISHEDAYLNYRDFMRQKDFGTSAHHQIGGYPTFTQEDPRDQSQRQAAFGTLLLQIDSDPDHHIQWGDLGTGQFFTNQDRLYKGDFSHVLYNWDCH